MMEESAKLVSLGMPTQLALEVARQISDGANAPNLVRLGVPTQLAKELAWQIANGADVENLAALGMPTQLAVEVARQMGSGAWTPTELSLQSLYSANEGLATPHTLAAMSSPPTVTVTGSTASPAGMGVTYTYIAGSPVPAYKGGGDKLYAALYRRFPAATDPVGGGNTANNESGSLWRVSVRTNSAKVSFSTAGTTLKLRFLVRTPGGIDQYVDKAGTLNSESGHVVLDFGSDADRIITCEGQKGAAFRAINVLDGYTATKPTEEPALAMFLGDSFTDGVGVAFTGDSYVASCAESLGFANFWASPLGDTGYVKDSGGTRLKLADRIVNDINRAKQYGAVKKLFIAMGINDIGLSGVEAEATICFNLARSLLPEASISVVGPWDGFAPGAPSGAYSAVKSAIQSAVGSRGGFHFLDAEGVAFAKNASTLPHPDEAGALTLGQWLASAERAALA